MVWLLGAVIAYLLYRNYQVEKRWRCLRYCWQSMSDFAAESLKQHDQFEDWRDVAKEQTALLDRFGVRPLTTDGIRNYELALLERNIPILTEHKVF